MSRGVEERIDWFRQNKPERVGLCLNHTWLATSLPNGGCDNATEGAWYVASNGHMNRSSAPPRGSWVWWRNYPNGHVALSLGAGLILSTDVRGPATVGTVPLHYIADVWGHEYIGWSNWYVETFEIGVHNDMQMTEKEKEALVKDIVDAVNTSIFSEKIFGDQAPKDLQDITFRVATRAGYRHATK